MPGNELNVLWLSHLVPFPPKGGVLQRAYHLLHEVSKSHNVYLVAFVQNELLEMTFGDVEKGMGESMAELSRICKNVRFVPIPCEKHSYGKHTLALKSLFHPLPYTINWLRSREMKKIASEWSKEYEFDLVHFDVISLAPYMTYFEEIPRVLDHHNIESHMMLRRAENEKNILKKFYFWQEGLKLRSYERRACPKFDLHITCSELDKQRLMDFIPGLDVHEVPNGVDVDYFSPQDESPVEKSMVFVGNLAWYPNTDAMLFFANELWPEIKSEIPEAVMNVVGAKPPRSLMEFSQQNKDFHVHGFVPDVRPYLSQANVYVCPIRDGGGTKLKILDALAMGTAIVADPIACEGIEVENNKSVLFAERPEEYVAQVKRVFSDPELRTSLQRNGRELATSKYSYSQIGKLLADLYCGCTVANP